VIRTSSSYETIAGCTAPPVTGEVRPDVSQHLGLVKRVASHFHSRLPSAIEQSDLIQAGIVGLLEALEAFDPERGNDFETFAKLRIRGAMLDEIRRAAWAPRSTVKLAVQAREAEEKIINETGSPATHRQIADALGLDVDRYHTLRARNQGLALSTTLEEIDFASESPTPDQLVDEESQVGALRAAIAGLKERERLILALYYDEELTLKEIGAVLSISESRASQILSAVAKKLRSVMDPELSEA
jgi:RNA polymerase sigma factor for flagellar operon FliA